MTDNPLSQFLDAVAKLAPAPGIVFRGLVSETDAPRGMTVLAAPVPASADPGVAREGAQGPLLVLLTRTARDLSALSAHPQEREVVLLPGTIWLRVELPDLPGLVVLEEVDPTRAPAPAVWPASRADLVQEVGRRLADTGAAPPGSAPGKYRGGWPGAPVADGAAGHQRRGSD